MGHCVSLDIEAKEDFTIRLISYKSPSIPTVEPLGPSSGLGSKRYSFVARLAKSGTS
jgi:hypothetical protein